MTGGVVHFEIHAEDTGRAKAFYGQVFGWTFERFPSPDMEYWLITTDDKNQGGGIMKRNGPTAPMGSSPNAFVCIVAVESVDAAVEAAEKAGATVAMPKGPIMGMGWGAYLIDTEGNLFGVFTMDTNAA